MMIKMNHAALLIARLVANFFTRAGGALGGSALALVVAHEGDPATLGQLALFISLLGTLTIISKRGLDVVIIRVVAEAAAQGSAPRPRYFLGVAVRKIIWSTLILSILGGILLKTQVLGPTLPGASYAFLAALPLLTWLALVAGYLKGVGLPWASPFFEFGGVSVITSLTLVGYIALGWSVTGAVVVVFFIVAIILISIVSFVILLPKEPLHSMIFKPSVESSWRGQQDLMLVALSAFVLQAGSFILAAPFLSDTQLGLIRGAERLAVVISFPGLVINSFIAARIVQQVTNSDLSGLRRTMIRASSVGGILALPPLGFFLLIPEFSLSLLGNNYIEVAPFLQIMAISNFVVVLFFPYMMAMNLGGLERRAMLINVSFLILGLFVFPLLTIFWGLSGFSIAYALIAVTRVVTVFVFSEPLRKCRL